jgi:hypothetical protein
MGHHAAITDNDLITSGNSRTRTHQTRVANLYATRTEIPSPNTNLYGVMHFTYCGE